MKYRALRIVSSMYMIISVLVGIGAIIFGFYLMISPSVTVQYTLDGLEFVSGPPLIGQGIATVVAGVISAVGLFAFAELINLFIAVEENTRLTSQYLKSRTQRSNPSHPLNKG